MLPVLSEAVLLRLADEHVPFVVIDLRIAAIGGPDHLSSCTTRMDGYPYHGLPKNRPAA